MDNRKTGGDTNPGPGTTAKGCGRMRSWKSPSFGESRVGAQKGAPSENRNRGTKG